MILANRDIFLRSGRIPDGWGLDGWGLDDRGLDDRGLMAGGVDGRGLNGRMPPIITWPFPFISRSASPFSDLLFSALLFSTPPFVSILLNMSFIRPVNTATDPTASLTACMVHSGQAPPLWLHPHTGHLCSNSDAPQLGHCKQLSSISLLQYVQIFINHHPNESLVFLT